ncbi:hypothetical protein U1Q18_021280 [Sarracenia purpurea var. burkii]
MELKSETYVIFLFPILFLLIFLLLLNHFKSAFPTKNPPLPPGPHPWPILGNLLHIGKNPHITLANFARSYGPLISLRLGTQLLIVASSPAAAAEVLKTHDRILSARHVPHVLRVKTPSRNHLSIGWAFECNDEWKFLRTICRTELFSGKAMESQSPLRAAKLAEMVEFLSGVAAEGKVVRVGEVVFATVFNMLSNVLMSRDFIRLEEEKEEKSSDSLESSGGRMKTKGLVRSIMGVASARNLCDFYPILGGLDVQGLKKNSTQLEMKIYGLWEPIIEERRERRRSGGSSQQQDFLDSLLDHAFNNDQIDQLFLELITAGTETTTLTIEWIMAELIRNPQPMAKLHQELARKIHLKSPTESDLPHLPYLQACVKETFRLHPPAPFLLPHRAHSSCTVMNYAVPKDAQVLVNVWAIGRDATVWEDDDPQGFKPERFLGCDRDYKGNDFELLPFSAGRRICPGLPMATKIVPLVLATLVHFFDWALPDGDDPDRLDMSEEFAVTLQKKQPLVLVPKVKKVPLDTVGAKDFNFF